MTSQNDRQDESLTGQVRDQDGHCPLTGHYFQPCVTHIFWSLKAVWNVHKIFSALSWERESSAISTPGNLRQAMFLCMSLGTH